MADKSEHHPENEKNPDELDTHHPGSIHHLGKGGGA